ncbi:electron transfer flavoprotein alpha subunit, partial [Phakopsora pachyrhizi]
LRSSAVQTQRSFSTTRIILDDVSSLLFLEHHCGKISSSTLSALNAAQTLGGGITAIITGSSRTDGIKEAIESAKKLPISKLLIKQDTKLERYLAEPLAPFIADLVKSRSFTHFIGGQSSVTKNVFPRIASLLDVSQVSDVMKIIDHQTFVRPIYAGNAIATLKSNDPIRVLTIRTASFEPVKNDSGSDKAEVEEIDSSSGSIGELASSWVSENLTKSERPELGSANRIVSGGRGLKNKENFDKIILPLADKLNSAIGASRAAVDSGYADNSLQVGQTGKVVSPDLYIAVGISGAIQHLAGMKDSKTIVAINKDADAPIFQVADVGLVADLFEAVPLSFFFFFFF